MIAGTKEQPRRVQKVGSASATASCVALISSSLPRSCADKWRSHLNYLRDFQKQILNKPALGHCPPHQTSTGR